MERNFDTNLILNDVYDNMDGTIRLRRFDSNYIFNAIYDPNAPGLRVKDIVGMKSTDLEDMPSPLVPNKYIRVNEDGTEYEFTDINIVVPITHNDFQDALLSSALIPNQWYLITDYTTYRPIVGDINTYHRGAIEPIYVLALDVNKVSTTAYSKLYPSEVLTYLDRQPITSKTFFVNAALIAGVPSGNFNLAVIDEHNIDLSGAPYPVKDGFNQNFYVNDGQTGIYFHSGNKGIDWDYDEDGNFHLITTSFPIYIGHNVDWNTNDGNTGDIEVTIEDLTRFSIDGSFDDYEWSEGQSGGQLYDAANGWVLYFDKLNRGYVWDVDALTGDIVFSNLGREMSAYLYYEDGENYGDYDLLVTSSNEFKPDWGYPILSPGTFYNGYTGFSITWKDETSEDFSAYNFGVTWTVSSDVVVLIGNTHDLTTDLYYLEGYVYANSESEMVDIESSEDAYLYIYLSEPSTYYPDFTADQFYVNYAYTERVNGYIFARYNTLKDFYCDIDYRGRLIKRYALQNVGTWTSGTTYTYNQVVIKNGIYYLCFATSTTADVNNNSVWRYIGVAGNYYGASNLPSYVGLLLNYDPNTFSYIPIFDTTRFDNTTSKINSSIKKGNTLNINNDLNVVILNFDSTSIFDTDIYVDGWILSQTYMRNTTGFFRDSILRNVGFTRAGNVSNCALSSMQNCNIAQMSGIFTDLGGCDIRSAGAIIAQRITSCNFVDVTAAYFAYGCLGSTLNVVYSLYCEQIFSGNNILTSPDTNMSQVKLLNPTSGGLGQFTGNIITSAFQNVCLRSLYCRNNKFYNTFTNIDFTINTIEGNVFNGSFQNSQMDNSSSSIAACGFSGNANYISGNQIMNMSTNAFTGTLSLSLGTHIFNYTGVSLPPIPGDAVNYTYKYPNINGAQAVESECFVRAVYHNSVTGSGQIVLATKRAPIPAGSFYKYGGSNFDTTINYSSVVSAITTGVNITATPIPAIGDVYKSSADELFYYAGLDDRHQFVGARVLGVETLTRVTGSGALSISITAPVAKNSAIQTSFFPSNFTAQVGCFGAARILNSIFQTTITNNPSFQACFAQNFNQEFELPLIVTGNFVHQLNRKTVTTTYSTSIGDNCVYCNGTFNINLMNAISIDGKTFQFKNVGSGNITIDPFSTQTIKGSLTYTLTPGASVLIQSDGSNWVVLNEGNDVGYVPYNGAVKDLNLGTYSLYGGYIQGIKSGVFAYLEKPTSTTIDSAGDYQYIEGRFVNNIIENFSTGGNPCIIYDGDLQQVFEIDWHASFSSDSANDTVSIGIFKNDILVSGSVMKQFCKNSGELYNSSGTCCLSLSKNDKITLVITDDGESTITMETFTTTINEFFD